MTKTTPDDDLALFFEAGRSLDLPDPLRARILADAAQVAVPAAPSWRARLKAWASGWAMPSVAGGVGATLAGLYIGLIMPVSVYDVPVWMDGPLGVFEQVTASILGLRDPLEMGF